MNERQDTDHADRDEPPTEPWEDLTLESLLEKAKSKEGNVGSAWLLIALLARTLSRGGTSVVLFKFAAEFFTELLRIRGMKLPKEPTCAELSKAFDKLHIFRRTRGRPELDDLEILMRFATEDQLLEEGRSVREVRRAFADRGIDLRGVHAQREKRADLVRLVSVLGDVARKNIADKLLRRGDWVDENK